MLEVLTQITLPNSNIPNIFSFATFVSGLALLVIVYTISSVRYHFRIGITPFSIDKTTYYLIALIGVGTLMTDLYFSEGWNTPSIFSDPLLNQAILATIFLLLVLIWMLVAFICPPIFNRFNYKKFTMALYAILAKGSDNELPVIADEFGRSASSVIKCCKNVEAQVTPRKSNQHKEKLIQCDYANDLLMMIGHKKFCRYIVSSAPGTAVEIFRAMSRYKKYRIPIGHFSINISTEALKNPDSPIYHEDDGFKSGLFGYIKPFSKAIYGDYSLVEALGEHRSSPLDLPYTFTAIWNAEQLGAYCRCTSITIENYLKNSSYRSHSFTITRAINIIKNSCGDTWKMNGDNSDYTNSEIYKRFYMTTNFVLDIAKLIDEYWQEQLPSFKTTNHVKCNIYDGLANLIFDLIFSASQVTTPPDKCWSIQYASVWDPLFGMFNNSKAMNIIIHKTRRLLYNSVIEMNTFPNYKSARILGFCLNVMGLVPQKDDMTKKHHSLHKMVIQWVTKNFHTLSINYPDIATTCLQGNISYDKAKNQLIHTHVSGMKKELKTITLQLD